MIADEGANNCAKSTIKAPMPQNDQKCNKGVCDLVAKNNQCKFCKNGEEKWPSNIGNKDDIVLPPKDSWLAKYLDDPRVHLL